MAVSAICNMDGCDKAVLNVARGWCSMHYQRWRKNGDPAVSKYDRQSSGRCRIEDCQFAKVSKGLCVKHYRGERHQIGYDARVSVRHLKHGKINDLFETDAAYIAGLIDADGTVTVTARNNGVPKPLVLVVNSNLPLINWLQGITGAGCAYETKTRPMRPDQNAAHWNKVHRYQVTGWKALSLLDVAKPYMRIKKRQAELVSSLALRGRDYPRWATPEQRAHGQVVMTEVRAMNRRGAYRIDFLSNLE